MDISDLTWRKSSYSGANGNCVEVAHVPTWRKSSYTSASGGNCVEVAQFPAASIAVRDSKDPEGPMLVFSSGEWRTFIAGMKAGELRLG
jgi:predicted secreted Zn-dependent protease